MDGIQGLTLSPRLPEGDRPALPHRANLIQFAGENVATLEQNRTAQQMKLQFRGIQSQGDLFGQVSARLLCAEVKRVNLLLYRSDAQVGLEQQQFLTSLQTLPYPP